MKDADVVKLAAAFLEEAASHGAGPFADRPGFKALQAALRPVKVAAPPPDDPRRKEGFVPAALGGMAEAKMTSIDHLTHVADVEFKSGEPVEKNLFGN